MCLRHENFAYPILFLFIFYHRVILLISVIPYTSEICVFVHQENFSLELYSMMHICECDTNRTHSKWILCDYAHINSSFEQINFFQQRKKHYFSFIYFVFLLNLGLRIKMSFDSILNYILNNSSTYFMHNNS